MPRETEPLAAQLVRALYDATNGSLMHRCVIERLDGATADAVEFAAARGWVQVEGGRSIALTESGRQLVEELGRI
jgi:Mn-dependent DtxR family transcriptional regulator